MTLLYCWSKTTTPLLQILITSLKKKVKKQMYNVYMSDQNAFCAIWPFLLLYYHLSLDSVFLLFMRGKIIIAHYRLYACADFGYGVRTIIDVGKDFLAHNIISKDGKTTTFLVFLFCCFNASVHRMPTSM